jgi:hypothetical protein
MFENMKFNKLEKSRTGPANGLSFCYQSSGNIKLSIDAVRWAFSRYGRGCNVEVLVSDCGTSIAFSFSRSDRKGRKNDTIVINQKSLSKLGIEKVSIFDLQEFNGMLCAKIK